MIESLLWADSTSDTRPIAWCNFNDNDLDGAYAWLDLQRANYRHGFARIFKHGKLLCQKAW